ncbi:trafficking protein particle complex subunit 1 [Anaeramoeba flamelloides]|uniref:Trafficking protein particle complex subunit n=1 Tax=Anaeramoeba flamelloides TaxID=1746091 RepID=A0AAV8AE23_9EUKA|nr:trafficking protein particle complex subunit [Anaeramoeba flamelloides]KAJ6240642.1 trafficking protein particle complex subunit 1 [Anaeramoeba flamelloides]
MVIYNFFVFNRERKCLYYKDWKRDKKSENLGFEKHNLSGLLITLKDFVKEIAPQKKLHNVFKSYSTNTYKLHFYESLTGITFVILTDLSVKSMQDALRHIYKKCYVEYVVRNPLYKVGEEIDCDLWVHKVNEFIVNLTQF